MGGGGGSRQTDRQIYTKRLRDRGNRKANIEYDDRKRHRCRQKEKFRK